MSISVRWLDTNKTVIHQRLDGQWSWDEFYQAHQDVIQMIKSVNHWVCVLAEWADKDKSTVPSNFYGHMLPLLKEFPAHHKMTVVVSKSTFVTMTIPLLSRISFARSAKQMKVVSDISEAYKLVGISSSELLQV